MNEKDTEQNENEIDTDDLFIRNSTLDEDVKKLLENVLKTIRQLKEKCGLK